MADISLTASMRSNLLSLQATQSLMDMTQERLSTGKKVNSAIDNPSSYYTAQSLNNRANDLSGLLDSMGQGIQTIKAADEALTTITSFAEQAKAIANSARDVSSNFDKYAISSEKVEAPITSGSIILDARDDLSKVKINLTDAGGKFNIYYDNGKSKEITLAASTGKLEEVGAAAVNAMQGLGLNAEFDKASGVLSVSSTDGTSVSWTNATTGGLAANTDNDVTSAKILTFTSSNGANSATIADAINKLKVGGVDAEGASRLTATADGKSLSITATNLQFHIFADTNDGTTTTALANKEALEKLGIGGSRKAGDASAVTAERTSYAKQFNQILEQIDAMANDAGYKGVNLLQENNLKVIFNEDRSSMIEIKGVDASSKGLGIAQAQNDWQKDSNIEAAISSIEDAIAKLRTIASDFGNNYSVVQSREEFTDNLINVLTEGADKLVLADMNEESANMLALQTRQQLAINSLSLASQAAQSVLKLFN